MTDVRSTFALTGSPLVEFMPIVDLADGRLLGMEAIPSWMHPTEGLIPAERLRPWAESNGEALRIGPWLASAACRAALSWDPSVQLSFRVSELELRHARASGGVSAALAESGLAPGRVVVQVPESAVADSATIGDVRALGALGVDLGVYDVGSYLSSFDPLSQLSVRIVEFSGVAQLGAADGMERLVAQSLIDMARKLGIGVVVGTLSTTGEVETARSLGCDAGHGPFFSAPLMDDEAVILGAARPSPRYSMSQSQTFLEGFDPVSSTAGQDGADAAEDADAAEAGDVSGDGAGDVDGPGGPDGAAPVAKKAARARKAPARAPAAKSDPPEGEAPKAGTAKGAAAAKRPTKGAAAKRAPAKRPTRGD